MKGRVQWNLVNRARLESGTASSAWPRLTCCVTGAPRRGKKIGIEAWRYTGRGRWGVSARGGVAGKM